MRKLVVAICMLMFTCQLLASELVIGVNQRDIYRFKDDSGNWAGKDIDLVKAVFAQMSHTYKIIEMPWTRVLKSIEVGEVDLTLAAAVSPERMAYAHFSNEPFRYAHYMLFVHKDKLQLFDSVKQLSDLKSKNVLVGALRGAIYSDTYYQLLKSKRFKSRLAFIDNDKSLPGFAMRGRVDGYIESEIEGKYYLVKKPKYNESIVPLIQINSQEEAMGRLMFSKKTVGPRVVTEFDQALTQLHQSGEYQRISAKYNPIENFIKAEAKLKRQKSAVSLQQ